MPRTDHSDFLFTHTMRATIIGKEMNIIVLERGVFTPVATIESVKKKAHAESIRKPISILSMTRFILFSLPFKPFNKRVHDFGNNAALWHFVVR